MMISRLGQIIAWYALTDIQSDIQVLFQSPDSPSPDTALAKRPHEDDEIEFTGAILPPDGIAYLGPPVKRRRRVKEEIPTERDNEGEEEEEEEEEASQLAEVDEEIALQEVDAIERGCQACGCFCNTVGAAPKRSGSGSTTLSPRVLGDLLRKSPPGNANARHVDGRGTQPFVSRKSHAPGHSNLGRYRGEIRSQARGLRQGTTRCERYAADTTAKEGSRRILVIQLKTRVVDVCRDLQ